MKKKLFILLIIYLFFFQKNFSQNFYLNIEGNTNKETRIIESLSYLNSHKDFLSIQNEINNIQNSLYKIGYIENQLTYFKKTNDTVFNAKLNLKTEFKHIYISYNKAQVNSTILNSISKDVSNNYFKLNFNQLEKALNTINISISEKGKPFSKLRLSDITKKDATNLKARLIIEGFEQKRTINTIVIKGYTKFPKSYLKHFLKIKPLQVFNFIKIKEKSKQLNNLSFCSEIKPPEILFLKDSTTLFLYIKKTKSNTFDGFLGFGTNEQTNKLKFDGYLNLSLTNNLNYGESFKILYKSDENNQKTFQIKTSLPFLFKTPIGTDVSLQIFKKDSSFITANQSIKLHYQIHPKHKIYAGITSSESNNLLNNNTNNSITDYTTKYSSFAYQYLNQSIYNSLFPIKSKFYIEGNFGNKKTPSRKEKQTFLNIEAFNIFKLNPKNSIYIRANGSSLLSNTYFENELLRFGGINSIRGFEENSLFSNLYGVINTEYRIQLNNTIYLHSIIDAAYFENQTNNTKNKLYGYGFGFGVITNSGLLKLNYANGKPENQKFKLSNSKIHISLIAFF